MKSRWAQLRDGGKISDANRLCEAVAEKVNGFQDAMLVTVAQGHPDNLLTVRTGQQPIGNLTHDGWVQYRNGAGHIEQTSYPEDAVGKRTFKIGYENATAEALAWLWRIGKFTCNLVQDSEVEFKNDSKVRFGGASFHDGAEPRHFYTDKQSLTGAVPVALIAERGRFCSLQGNAKSRFIEKSIGPAIVIGAQEGQTLYAGSKGTLTGLRFCVAQDEFC